MLRTASVSWASPNKLVDDPVAVGLFPAPRTERRPVAGLLAIPVAGLLTLPVAGLLALLVAATGGGGGGGDGGGGGGGGGSDGALGESPMRISFLSE